MHHFFHCCLTSKNRYWKTDSTDSVVSYVYFTGQMFVHFMRTVICKMQLFSTSHKRSRNLKCSSCNHLVYSALGTSDLSKFINMKILYIKLGKRDMQCYITKQLVHSQV